MWDRDYKITTRYHAYISYSHIDSRFATWLQTSLESWRIPTELVDQLGFDRLKPVFLDRADLSSSSNLGNALRDVLDQSGALIVVCSQHAAKSKWVNEEINYFQEKHGSERIFSIIASDYPPTCFPSNLLRDISGNTLEPIAADARRGFDGRKNALLKIIAGVLKVEYDRLRHRDLRRQYNRMTAIATGSIVATVITLTLAILAINARNDADEARNDANRGRAGAEDLISFMVGDLRARLEPIGQLSVLDAVGTKALAYYATLRDGELTLETQLGRAKTLRQIGEVRMSQGDSAAALTAFRSSNQMAHRIVKEFGDSESALFEASQSHFYIGYVHYEQKDFDQAREQFNAYLNYSQDLVARNPESRRYQGEIAYAYSNLGALELAANRFTQAELYYRKTLSINQASLAALPEELGPKKDLAETLSWLGEIASRTGNVHLSVSWFEQEYELRKLIANLSDDMYKLEDLADTASILGYSELLAGHVDRATAHFEEARTISERLIALDPSNYRWQLINAFTGVDLSQASAARGDLSTALTQIDTAIIEIRGLAESTHYQMQKRERGLLKSLAQKAKVLRQAGDAQAQQIIRTALSVAAKIDSPEDSKIALIVAGLHLHDGDLAAQAGDKIAANKAWSEALNSLAMIPDNLHEPVGLMTRAALLDRTNKNGQATVIRKEIAQRGFFDDEGKALTYALIGVL